MPAFVKALSLRGESAVEHFAFVSFFSDPFIPFIYHKGSSMRNARKLLSDHLQPLSAV